MIISGTLKTETLAIRNSKSKISLFLFVFFWNNSYITCSLQSAITPSGWGASHLPASPFPPQPSSRLLAAIPTDQLALRAGRFATFQRYMYERSKATLGAPRPAIQAIVSKWHFFDETNHPRIHAPAYMRPVSRFSVSFASLFMKPQILLELETLKRSNV
jgi:hypothetical protein